MLTQPFFLIGLLAIGIPIAVHLLQLRRHRQVYFSNVEMLEALQNENRRQRNLRQLLILTTRILTILFLVLAFCQPVIRHKGSHPQTGNTVVSVYIDNSYSMECGGMEGSLIESAKKKAREIADAYKPDDQFQLLTNDIAGSQFHWLSREDFLSAVDQLQTSPHTSPLSKMAQRQNEFLRTATAANRHAYILSDFQRSTADISAYPTDSTIHTTFIPLEGSTVANAYIDSLSFNSPAYFPGANVEVEVFVRNNGDKAIERLPLRLFVNDKQRALTAVDVAAHGSTTAKMVFTIGQEETLQGYVETTDYPITFDDKMYFSLTVMRQAPVLTVNGNGENIFLQKLFLADSLIAYHTVPATQIDYTHLSQQSLIILNELHNIPSGLAQTLHEYVSNGGSLLVVPAEKAETDSYNQMLSMMQAPHLTNWTPNKARAQEIQYQSRIYQGVFQSVSDEVEMPTITGHYFVQHPAEAVSQSLIKLADGTSYLSYTPCGQGHLYLFSAPLRDTYTDFVHQALFVPTLYNMALYSQTILPPYSLLSSTAPISLSCQYPAGQVPHLSGEDSSIDLIPDIRNIGGRHSLIPHGDLTTAGNYRLMLGTELLQTLSFNYDRQESDLDFYSHAELKKLLSENDLDNCGIVPSVQKSMTDYIRERNQGTPLWRWCLVLALLSLLAETILLRKKRK